MTILNNLNNNVKNVLIISTSLRTNSNSCALANAFLSGVKDAGNNVELVSLKDKNIAFCKGCFVCQKTGRCIINDDANEIVAKMKNADVIAFATPIYYYEMCGQMKTLLDRANPLYDTDYKFKDIYLLSCAIDDGDDVDKRAISGLEGWIECFERAALVGTVFAGGVNDEGEIEGHEALKRAYDLGRSI